MKTPEEIKKGLKACCPKYDGASWISCRLDCPYEAEGNWCKGVLHTDTLAYINQLESRLAQAERERDAAVKDLQHTEEPCDVCKKKSICEQYCPQNSYDCVSCLDKERCIFHNCTLDNDLWEWRGVCEENSKEDKANEGRT